MPSSKHFKSMVILFPTYGRRCQEDGNWLLDVHGWSFDPQEDSRKRQLLLAALRKLAGLTPQDEQSAMFSDRVRAFVVRHLANAAVTIQVLGQEFVVGLPDRDGHFSSVIEIAQDDAIERLVARDGRGWLDLQTGAAESINGRVHLLAGEGVSVISDIDDTIKITQATSRRETLRRTFCKAFEAVDGISDLYREWQDRGACFHYVSASPWQLYQPLSEFLEHTGFPAGSVHLEFLSWRQLLNGAFLESPAEHKRREIERILNDFAAREFVLVGDAGQQDAALYGQLARSYPDQIKCVLIRALGSLAQTSSIVGPHLGDLQSAQWRVFEDPRSLRDLI